MTTPYQQILDRVDAIRTATGSPWTDDGCGVTRQDTQIAAFVHIDAYAAHTTRHRVLLLGGLSGSPDDVEAVVSVLERYATSRRVRNRVALSAIPCGNPDGLNLNTGPRNRSEGNPSGRISARRRILQSRDGSGGTIPLALVGFMAPDFVVEVRPGDAVAWEHSGVGVTIAQAINAVPMADDDSLLSALASGLPNSLGQIPGLRLTAPVSAIADEIDRLWTRLMSEGPIISQAREELARRRIRSAVEIAEALAARYGDTLDPVVYTQGVALSGSSDSARLRVKYRPTPTAYPT